MNSGTGDGPCQAEPRTQSPPTVMQDQRLRAALIGNLGDSSVKLQLPPVSMRAEAGGSLGEARLRLLTGIIHVGQVLG